eukprot:m.239830 g.239830  ORF g.239830 m.239830 type:complete len:607 (+) comp14109_c0_seq1:128-1948(+)
MSEMVPNDGGGLGFGVTDEQRAMRFLILGSEGGTYYAGSCELTKESADSLMRLLDAGKGLALVDTIVNVSLEGRAAKQEPTMFALAMCAKLGDDATRKHAFEALGKVCRIPTHLFMFLSFVNGFSKGKGFGRLQQRAFSLWYNTKAPVKLAFAMTKYKKREGWAHGDVLRLAHVKPVDDAHKALYKFATKGAKAVLEDKELVAAAGEELIAFLKATEAAMTATAVDEELLALVSKHHLAWEHISRDLLVSPRLWFSMLKKMPIGALVRNLGKMSKIAMFGGEHELASKLSRSIEREDSTSTMMGFHGRSSRGGNKKCAKLSPLQLVAQGLRKRKEKQTKLEEKKKAVEQKIASMGLLSEGEIELAVEMVVSKLRDEGAIRSSRLHPYNLLTASLVYNNGAGHRSSASWEVNEDITTALNDAFYLSFKNVEATGKRFLLAMDVSGSMSWSFIANDNLVSARTAAAMMAMITKRTEENVTSLAFSNNLVPLELRDDDLLPDLEARIDSIPMGGTDCSLPMVHAREEKLDVDVFVIYTDCETNCNARPPHEELQAYRDASGIADAKLIVVAMTSGGFTIADPQDPNMLDVVGFDASAPALMRAFIMGEL